MHTSFLTLNSVVELIQQTAHVCLVRIVFRRQDESCKPIALRGHDRNSASTGFVVGTDGSSSQYQAVKGKNGLIKCSLLSERIKALVSSPRRLLPPAQ